MDLIPIHGKAGIRRLEARVAERSEFGIVEDQASHICANA